MTNTIVEQEAAHGGVRDFFTDPAVVADSHAYYRQIRGVCPVFREPHHGAVMVTGYDAAMEVLGRQARNFSSANAVTGPLPPLPFAPAGDDIRDQLDAHRQDMPWSDHLVTADGPLHARDRLLLTQVMTHTRLKANEEYLRGLVDRLIDGLLPRGECEVTKGYAHALSTLVIADLLGVPEDERQELVDLLGLPPTQLGGDAAEKALTDPLTFLYDRFARYFEDRRASPRDDFMSDLAHATYRDGSVPTPETVVRLATFLFGAGQDTSARLIAFAFRTLGECPHIQARLRAEPERIPDFIEEVLRMENPVKTVGRLAVVSTEVAGTPIPAGTTVTVCVSGANRDPAHFDDPETFDIDRAHLRDHVSFSRGAHGCLGAPLARMEARVTLERFLARTKDIRISEAHHGPAGARRYEYEPTYLLYGMTGLYVEFDPA